jgi:hypothetical protein
MPDMKHVGRQINNQRKCFVAYRVVPKDPENCLVVFSDSLDASYHDSLVEVVESNAGQTAYELADAMMRVKLADGRNMLTHFSATGKLVKMPTRDIEMTPNFSAKVNLAELNSIIAQQKGVAVEDLALQNGDDKEALGNPDPVAVYTEQPAPVAAPDSGVLSDEDLASQYRSQADAMFKEAQILRKQAEELVPTKKKAVKTKASA